MKLRSADAAIGIVLGCAALLVRLPFRGRYLYHWDSVNFALSLEHYDVRLHQPQPPGYFLYSMLGRLVNLAAHDPNTSLIWISLVSGALGVVAIYWLGLRMFDRETGLVAALLTLVSPLHWFYSDVALSYALEFVLVTLLAGLCYRQLDGDRAGWLRLAILFGVAGGVRQNDLVLLFPLWLVSLRPLTWSRRAASALVLGLVVLGWLWPMMALSGGPGGFFAALLAQGDARVLGDSAIGSARELGLNALRVAIFVGYGLCLAALPLLAGPWLLGRPLRAALADRRVWVCALWVGPALAFYVFVFVRQHGYIFTFLPALILLAAAALVRLGRRARGWAARIYWPWVALLLVGNGLFFLLGPAALFGSAQLVLQAPTRQSIAQRDQFLAERIDFIQHAFDPKTSAVLAGSLNFRHPDYYLRQFQATSLSYRLGPDFTPLPDNVHTLILFDDLSLPALPPGMRMLQVPLDGQNSIRYITWGSAERALISQSQIEIEPR